MAIVIPQRKEHVFMVMVIPQRKEHVFMAMVIRSVSKVKRNACSEVDRNEKPHSTKMFDVVPTFHLRCNS